jgi:hypothetical protein
MRGETPKATRSTEQMTFARLWGYQALDLGPRPCQVDCTALPATVDGSPALALDCWDPTLTTGVRPYGLGSKKNLGRLG